MNIEICFFFVQGCSCRLEWSERKVKTFENNQFSIVFIIFFSAFVIPHLFLFFMCFKLLLRLKAIYLPLLRFSFVSACSNCVCSVLIFFSVTENNEELKKSVIVHIHMIHKIKKIVEKTQQYKIWTFIACYFLFERKE